MLLSHILAAAVLAAAPAAGADSLSMRIPAAGLDLGQREDAAVFAARIAAESRRFCAAHAGTLTPNRQGDLRICARAMGQAAVSALPDDHWRRFMRAGGRAALNRLQG
jgi:UrcA family protein